MLLPLCVLPSFHGGFRREINLHTCILAAFPLPQFLAQGSPLEANVGICTPLPLSLQCTTPPCAAALGLCCRCHWPPACHGAEEVVL